jgi:hypothetical protein
MGINGYSSSIELGAQNVQPHQIPKRPYLLEKDMPIASYRLSWFMSTCSVKAGAAAKKVCGCSVRL